MIKSEASILGVCTAETVLLRTRHSGAPLLTYLRIDHFRYVCLDYEN